VSDRQRVVLQSVGVGGRGHTW